MQKCLFNWSNYSLTVGGKLILIKHVLQSMPIHLLTSIGLPKGVINRLERLFVSFFWNNSDNSKHFHWIIGSAICTPTSEGGHGLRYLADIS